MHKTGDVYFMVSYLEDTPIMETVVYLGKSKSEDGELRHTFQDFESWKERGAYPNTAEGPGKVFLLPSTELSNIQPLEEALAELNAHLARLKRRRQ